MTRRACWAAYEASPQFVAWATPPIGGERYAVLRPEPGADLTWARLREADPLPVEVYRCAGAFYDDEPGGAAAAALRAVREFVALRGPLPAVPSWPMPEHLVRAGDLGGALHGHRGAHARAAVGTWLLQLLQVGRRSGLSLVEVSPAIDAIAADGILRAGEAAGWIERGAYEPHRARLAWNCALPAAFARHGSRSPVDHVWHPVRSSADLVAWVRSLPRYSEQLAAGANGGL